MAPSGFCAVAFTDRRFSAKQLQLPLLGDVVPGEALEVVSLIECNSVGGDRMQRNFEPMRKQVEAGQSGELTDVTAKGAYLPGFKRG